MIGAGKPPPAGAAWRSYTFRPPDPSWVAPSQLRALQRALRGIEPDLDVWWSPARGRGTDQRKGRWRIVSWSPGSSSWLTVFYVEGPLGEYRPIDPMDPIISQVRKVAWAGRQRVADLEREVEEHNARLRTKRYEELERGCREWLEDFSARRNGIRQTFGPGYIRRRPRAAEKVAGEQEASVHQRWLREQMGLGLRLARPGQVADWIEVSRRRGLKP